MEETTALAVCKHIRENVDVSKLLFKGCHFNAIVNNADFFSGHIYSDGGSMYWGTIQQRTDSINNCQLYKYFGSRGADSVNPFKTVPAGYLPAKMLSGSFSKTINGGGSSWTGETDVTIKFDPPFNKTPVNVDVWETGKSTKYYRNDSVYCVPMTITKSSCKVRIYSNIQWSSVNTFKWEAMAFYE